MNPQKALVLSFQKAIEGFLLYLHAEGHSQSTIAIYKWGLSKFIPYIQEKKF
jgi:site-specific recombinase XerD